MAEGGHSLNLSCAICFEYYKTPKVLTCGHTFCCQCVRKLVGRNATLQCPACRKHISLPQSGKVEDFITNFALQSSIPDRKRMKKGDGHLPKVGPGWGCPQHKTPTKFYCKSCKKPVCADCLLRDHKPDVHSIGTSSDMAAIFSEELQKHLQLLKVYDKEGKSLSDKILKAFQCFENDKKTLQDQVNNALKRKQEMLKKSAENLIEELNKKAEGHTGAYTDLQAKHHHLYNLSSKIHEKCNALHHHFKNSHLSHAGKLEEISKCLVGLKAATESLKTTCQLAPTKVGLTLKLEEAPFQLGIKLSTMPNTPSTLSTAMQLPYKSAEGKMLLAQGEADEDEDDEDEMLTIRQESENDSSD